ncbi:2OG-Fe(II) oxygenase [Mucilaginibacter celer]|uniref:Prolyl 4-hydroxylase subunit alpha n=1 Tax=Mucilaginibacter celer TaxID=2305508 RepID=A0A494VHB7_9SPHI|nr:2OG-Fe(II) oxygenase [Mucilaginibacter celer]AYL94056.1 prolyl 4-hydroxylase subunit alpha [Mucilaginibacter celer]
MEVKQRIDELDWPQIAAGLDNKGYAQVKGVLTSDECEELKAGYANEQRYRKTVVMERHNYGKGEYKYFAYPLPALIQQLRESVYPHLAPVANNWMLQLNKEHAFPGSLDNLIALCHQQGQVKPTALILKYEQGGYNAMHQDLYGEVFFPMQLVFILDEPGKDYEGGEFVLTEQKPREQSRAIVLKPGKGDMLIFTTSFRPAKGLRGYHRVNMKHGVSELTEGKRHSMGIIFHDAK